MKNAEYSKFWRLHKKVGRDRYGNNGVCEDRVWYEFKITYTANTGVLKLTPVAL